MNVVDILISIVVVTILVTVILAIVTYVAYKLRLSREPARAEDDPSALRYFVTFPPPAAKEGAEGRPAGDAPGRPPPDGPPAPDGPAGRDDGSSLDRLDRDVAEPEGHASQA